MSDICLQMSVVRPSLFLSAEGKELSLSVSSPQTLSLGIAKPVGVGQPNEGNNVGAGIGVFRDKSGVTLNFRSVVGVNGTTVVQNGDSIEISAGGAGVSHVESIADPSVTDNGFSTGTTWTNTSSGKTYILIDNTAGAAVWTQASGDAWTSDLFLSTVGQVTFILSSNPIDSASLDLSINGVEYDIGTDFTQSGVTITWLNNSFTMDAGDTIQVRYR